MQTQRQKETKKQKYERKTNQKNDAMKWISKKCIQWLCRSWFCEARTVFRTIEKFRNIFQNSTHKLMMKIISTSYVYVLFCSISSMSCVIWMLLRHQMIRLPFTDRRFRIGVYPSISFTLSFLLNIAIRWLCVRANVRARDMLLIQNWYSALGEYGWCLAHTFFFVRGHWVIRENLLYDVAGLKYCFEWNSTKPMRWHKPL